MTTKRILSAVTMALALTTTGCSAAAHVAAVAPTAGTTHAAEAKKPSHKESSSAPAAAADSVTTASTPAGQPVSSALRSVHSPGAVAEDIQLSPGQCHARALDAASGKYLPDAACTMGAVDPAVTQDNIATTICKSGYTATVRPPASATEPVKAEELRAYGETSTKTTELDHLVSLELGGTNSVSNLWPEMNRAGATGTTNPKDAVEDTLHKAVCSGKVKLADAQQAIATNWTTALSTLGLG